MRSLVDAEQEWPGHCLGRHFKSVMQLDNISKIDKQLKAISLDPKCYDFPDFNGRKKVNIGSGMRDWQEWVFLDERDAKGVTKISFK